MSLDAFIQNWVGLKSSSALAISLSIASRIFFIYDVTFLGKIYKEISDKYLFGVKKFILILGERIR
jgi:hypothetical protein